MRNRYRFDALPRAEGVEAPSAEAASAIFFAMCALLRDGRIERRLPTLDALAAALPAGACCLAQCLVASKGKTRRFVGAFAVAQPDELIGFLRAAVAGDDLRELLIGPAPGAALEWVVHIDEDAQCVRYVPA
ncbi:hypothetical protein A7A76_23150 [Lysobacter enzymogenes]|uniref:hypothetical protein n=1 Tax=Lysobacter enzymogenes TaxID=69 RepID=UPI0019D2003B|nr:hypothetical protein [Lysobacter enzymogenes]MBN7137602.1 hypothetical protein [Lysobacter enzymogenes]